MKDHEHHRLGDADKDSPDFGKPQGIQVCDLHGIRENQFVLMKNDIYETKQVGYSTKQLSKISLLVSACTLGCTIALLVLHFIPSASQMFTLLP